MKNIISSLILAAALASLMAGCASSGGSKKGSADAKKTESVSDIGKDKLGDDELKARLERARVYTKDNKVVSRIKGDEPQARCRFDGTKKEIENWPMLLKVGYACAYKKDWATLYKIGQEMSKVHIDSPWGPYFLSIVSEQASDMPRAIWMIGLAERKAPDNAVIKYQKARLLWLNDSRDAAFHEAKEAYKLDPDLLEAALLMGQVYMSDYQFKEAEEYFGKVLKENRRVFTATIGMAESLAQQSQYKKSIPYFEKALRLKKNRKDIALKIADIYENQLQNYKRAISWYQKVIDTFPVDVISLEKKRVQEKLNAVIAKLEKKNNPVAEKKSATETRAPASSPSAGGAQ